MRTKQILCILAFVPFIFFSCEKDDPDYRDGYEGTYVTNIVGSILLVDVEVVFPMDISNQKFIVTKYGKEQLKITFMGESTIVAVDKEGNFIIPTESASETQTDPETGTQITMNLTSSGFGTITNKTLYMKETVLGTATVGMNEEVENSAVEGSFVYNGSKSSSRRTR